MTAPSFDPGTPAEKAVREILLSLLAAMESNVPGALLGGDPEFLHDLRVAVRRSRCALTRIHGLFPPRRTGRFERDLRWIGVRTGPTRDLDIYLQELTRLKAGIREGSDRELAPLIDLLCRRRAKEQRKLSRTLTSLRLHRFFSDWRRFLDSPRPYSAAEALGPPAFSKAASLPDSDVFSRPVPEAASRPIADAASRPISQVASASIIAAYHKALRRGELLDESESTRAFHKLRIDCKNLRYLLGFFACLYPEKALQPLTKEVKRLQDHLGEINDLAVQRGAMEELSLDLSSRDGTPVATLLAMGRLFGRMEERQVLSMESFRKRFRRFGGRVTKSRFEELFGAPPLP